MIETVIIAPYVFVDDAVKKLISDGIISPSDAEAAKSSLYKLLKVRDIGNQPALLKPKHGPTT